MAKKNLQTKKEIPSEEDYSYTSEEIPSNTILPETSSQTSLSGPIGPNDFDQIQQYRILEYKSRMSAYDTDIKHAYFTIPSTTIGPTGFSVDFNSITAGTNANQRAGTTIHNHGATIRCTFTKLTNPALAVNSTWEPGVRIVVTRFHIPLAATPIFATGDTNPPINPASCFTNANIAPNILTYVRNPNTFHNWEVLYDKVHFWKHNIAGVGNSDVFVISGSEQVTLHFDLKRKITQFFDTTGVPILNRYTISFVTNENTDLQIIAEGTIDYTFSDASNI